MSKTKATSAFTDPFAAVELQPIKVAGQAVHSRIAVRVRDDAGDMQVQAILGKDYPLLPNRKVRDLTEDILSRTPKELGGFRNLKTLWNGKHYVDYFSSNNEITTIKNGSVVSLHLGLMAWNSYDGTRKVGFEVFALNPFCTNQYHSRNRFGFFAWRHTPGATLDIDMDDALENITRGASNLIAIAPAIGRLHTEPLKIEHLVAAKAETELPKSYWGDVLDQLKDEELSRFGLFQALTNVASHKMTGLPAINVGTSITEHFLGANGKDVINHTTAAAVVALK